MQDRRSGTLPRNLLISEINELGRTLAPLIQRGSPLERSRRSEVRALLRDAFLATQEDRVATELQELFEKLRTLHLEHFKSETTGLTHKLGHRDEFGAVDEQMTRVGSFSTAGDRFEQIAENIQSRIERTLSSLAEDEETEGDGTKPYQLNPESQELITKKV